MQLVLDTNGLMVKKRNNCFFIISKNDRRMISPNRVTSIAITADCLLSTAAIKLAVQNQIPIFFLDKTGRTNARLWSKSFGKEAQIRRALIYFSQNPETAIPWIKKLLLNKTAGQQALLEVILTKSPHVLEIKLALTAMETLRAEIVSVSDLDMKACKQSIMGYEGVAARYYWKAISAYLPKSWTFSGRSRRPALDGFNALLNYSYGMLYALVESAIFAAGLDPYQAIMHADIYNKPTLVYDFIEPFRPWVDAFLIELMIEEHILTRGVDYKKEGVWVNRLGKKLLIPRFNAYFLEVIKIEGVALNRKNHIYRYAGRFAQSLITKK